MTAPRRQVNVNSNKVHSNAVSALAWVIPEIDSVQATFKAIADYSSNTAPNQMTCYPCVITIAKAVGLSERTIRYHLKALKALKLITTTPRFYLCKRTGQKRNSSNLITINLVVLKQLLHKAKVRVSLSLQGHVAGRSAPKGATKKQHSFDTQKTTYNAKRIADANREHEKRIAEMRDRKVSAEQAGGYLSKIREMMRKG